jgi:hypothetical protein
MSSENESIGRLDDLAIGEVVKAVGRVIESDCEPL